MLEQGKVVLLLDKKNLIYDIATPKKDEAYYVNYNTVRQHFFENKVQNVEIVDDVTGIKITVDDLKFKPDSPELLEHEKGRIKEIAAGLNKIISENNGYTILVEGHTADVGKPVGQLNLSIERTRTVMNALVEYGLPKSIFTYKGYGGTRPVASNENEEGRAQNRRVDIIARPVATYIQYSR